MKIKKENLNINIVGLGFVGLITTAVFSKKGFMINAIENDKKKLEKIKKNQIEFYEPHLNQNLKKYKNRINFISNLKIDEDKINIVFICVGTPSKKNGKIDLKFLKNACNKLKIYKNQQIILIIKSTVLPGTINGELKHLLRNNKNIKFCSNPEFLQEGQAFKDFLYSEKIVVGSEDRTTSKIMKYIYSGFNSKYILTNFITAEYIKYLSNNLLACLISYSNFMKILSFRLRGIELKKSFDAVKLDKRWFGNPAKILNYFHPGLGYGGSCLPKDVKSLEFMASKLIGSNNILSNIININLQITNEIILDVLNTIKKKKFDKIIFLGISFKPGSDDVRESKSVEFIKKLLKKKNFNFYIYDEKVKKIKINNKFFKVKGSLPYFNNKNFYILLTGWKRYLKFLRKIPKNNYYDTRELI